MNAKGMETRVLPSESHRLKAPGSNLWGPLDKTTSSASHSTFSLAATHAQQTLHAQGFSDGGVVAVTPPALPADPAQQGLDKGIWDMSSWRLKGSFESLSFDEGCNCMYV